MMPQNNQVLQKREGYSQIFFAYSMLDMALQLDWKGKDDIYEGESKNVALLYEYWIFFELYDIVRGIEGCEPISTDDHPFIGTNPDGGLSISLKQGVRSCQSFQIAQCGAKVNLYYNRTFSPRDFHATRYEVRTRDRSDPTTRSRYSRMLIQTSEPQCKMELLHSSTSTPSTASPT